MKRLFRLSASIVVAITSAIAQGSEGLKPLSQTSPDDATARPPYRTLRAPEIGDVRLADGFWAPRMKTCREVTLPYAFEVCDKTGRISNFVKASGRMEGKFEGIWFNDSDVYKVLQGAAYELAVNHDPELDKLTDDVIAKIAAAQQRDGYLFCYYTIDNDDQRFKNIHPTARHELYCMGHMIEAGAVHGDLTGKRNMLEAACRLADHIGSIFGPGKQMMVPEHQEIELALIKLYRVTGEERYLKLAQFFIDQRGNDRGHKLYGAYSQDHLPVRRQSEIVGHAVRAMYNCIGMADTQKTRYPWDGRVTLLVDPQEQHTFDLCVRVPGWCRDSQTPGGLYRADGRSVATVSVNGKSLDVETLEAGYLRIDRPWEKGDVVELDLPMPVRRLYAHEKIRADRGRVALQRGPIVFCVEAVDHQMPLQHMFLPSDAPLTAHYRDDLLGGVTVITANAAVQTADSDKPTPVKMLAVPYYVWDNRAGGAMSVWLAEAPSRQMKDDATVVGDCGNSCRRGTGRRGSHRANWSTGRV